MIGADTTLWEVLSVFASSIGKDRQWIRREPNQEQTVDRYDDELALLRIVLSFRQWLVSFTEIVVEYVESVDTAISIVSLRSHLEYLAAFNKLDDIEDYFENYCEELKSLRTMVEAENMKDVKIEDLVKEVAKEVIEFNMFISDKKALLKILAPCINRVMPTVMQLLVELAVANNYHTVPPFRGYEYAPEEASLPIFSEMLFCLMQIRRNSAFESYLNNKK